MEDSKKAPWYQQVFISFGVILAGFLAGGAALDSIANAIALISPTITYIGTATIISLLLITQFFLRKHPIPWLFQGRVMMGITRIGVNPRLLLIGLILLLWVPRLIDFSQRMFYSNTARTGQIKNIPPSPSPAKSPSSDVTVVTPTLQVPSPQPLIIDRTDRESPTSQSPSPIESFRQSRLFHLVWRIYFNSTRTDDTREPPLLPNRGGIHLVAFIPNDRLYRETYWDERMHIVIKSPFPDPSVELSRNHIASPFRRYDELRASLVQFPALGRFLASYWKLEERITGADLEKLWYQIYFLNGPNRSLPDYEESDEWPNTVRMVVVMADDIPLAVFERGKIPAVKPIDKNLIVHTVDPYTGEVKPHINK